MSALARTPTLAVVVDPATGEAIELATASTDTLAEFLANTRELESRFREQKRAASDEILGRMDREASWTARVGAWTLKGKSPAPVTVYDAQGLRETLDSFVDEGLVSVTAAGEAVEVVTTLKVHARGVNALLKLGGRVAEAVRAHGSEQSPERTVSVSRSAR